MNATLRWWLSKVGFNALLLGLAMFTFFFAVEHAVFFYSFPPDMSRFVDVPWPTYVVFGFWLFMVFKAWHYVEEASEVFAIGDDDPEKLSPEEVAWVREQRGKEA